jgi:thiamine biosynthesis lipoprotein
VKKLLILAAIILLLTGCAGREPLSRTGFMMDTVVTVTLYDSRHEAILEGTFQLMAEYEAMFSRHMPDSEIARLNAANGEAVTVSDEVREVLAAALAYSERTDGKYDVTIAPVMDLWDFHSEDAVVPSPDAVEAALALVDWRNVVVEGETVRLLNGAQLDLGSVAKGYIADRLGDYLRSQGVGSGWINLGGNVLTVGSKNGDPFRIGIQKPFATQNETVGTVEVVDGSVVSSGLYERYFRAGDTMYHHIIDPNTGFPADSGLTAVTILSPRSLDGDILSTCCFLLGLDDGMALIESTPEVEAVFIDTAGEMHFTSGFEAGDVVFQAVF